MSSNLDLTHLTPEEVEHLQAVLSRAQAVEDKHNALQSGSPIQPADLPTHRVFQSTWKDTHGINEEESYKTGTDIVRAALTGGDETSTQESPDPNVDSDANSPSVPTPTAEPDKISDKSPSSADEKEPEAESSPEKSDEKPTESIEPVPNKEDEESETAMKKDDDKAVENHSDPKGTPSKTVQFVKPTNSVEEGPLSVASPNNDDEDKDILTPLPKTSPTSPKAYDSKSMVSRASMHPHEFVGEINVTLIYYPPSKVQQVDLPPGRTTRMPNDSQVDVLTRKTYAALSGSRIRVVKDNKTGAKAEDDGELHMLINDAFGLRLPSGMSSRKPRTYVKCYMLPDRYHGAKMRSSVVKDTLSPNYKHKFVFRGFSKSEFNEKAIEIVIGGIMSGHGRHLVVGGIRLSSGNKKLGNQVPWKNSNEEEISLWDEAFEKPCTEVTASLSLRPRIKLTYK